MDTTIRYWTLSSVMWLYVTAASFATDMTVRRIDGVYPTAESTAFASGSGLVVGRKFVLTNRHVVQDDDRSLFEGFKIYVSPDYKKPVEARVVYISDDFDLALLETKVELQFEGLSILTAVAPLSERVIAYGFPLGSKFGIGLTTTGGQISRHPVSVTETDDEEDVAIKSALWHDAILASGNSGGPLFSETSILIGINFAHLTTENQHALAVPSNVVLKFLQSSNVEDGVTAVDSLSTGEKTPDPKAATVFIEAMASSAHRRTPRLDPGDTIRDKLIALLKRQLGSLSDAQLSTIESGDFKELMQPAPATEIKPQEVSRVRGSMTVIQILEGQMLVNVDGVKFFILLADGKGAELRAKLGDEVILDIPIDYIGYVADPISYTTVAGEQSYAFPLVLLTGLAEDTEIKKLIGDERVRREKAHAQEAKEAALEATKRLADQRSLAERRYLAKLQRTFTSRSGKHRINAAVVQLDDDSVVLVNVANKKRSTVRLDQLSSADRDWLKANQSNIRVYGPMLLKLYRFDVKSALEP
jgi:hypothetical protein